ncbi:MAG TPA: sulfatase [Vicinamibacteria bacterium]|nr:sulfatase [Vicinamibacteria bacterium]
MLAACLAVPLVAAKAVHWGRPGSYGWGAWLRDLAVSAHQDVAFAAGFGLVAAVCLHLLGRWPRAQARVGAAFVAVGAGFVLYAVASVQVFAFLRSPLTYALLYLAGDMGTMRSSIGSFLTPGVAAAALLLPAAYVVLARRVRPSGRRVVAWAAGLLVLAAGWSTWGAHAANGRWSDRSDVLIARSPHLEILSSTASVLLGESVPTIREAFPAAHLEDFRPTRHERPASPFAPAVRNVLVVVLESTSTRYLGLYGSPYATTPSLQAEAAHAVVYDRFYAHVGFTANALASLTLSIHPYMTWREYTQEYPDFPGRSAADVLQTRGYRTAFLSSAHLDYVNMDTFLGHHGYEDVRGWKQLGGGDELNSWGGADSVLVDRTLEWIDRDRSRPFFATVWTNQGHHPYDPAPGQPEVDFFGAGPRPADDYDLGRYLNAVSDVDRQLGRLFAGLRQRGLDDETLVVVTGDHGEAFGDPHPTWGHGFRLYDEGVRVPLVVWSPTLFPRGRREATLGGHVDLNPTVLDLLGIDAPAEWEGRSLFAPGRPPRVYFYAANDDYLLGVREHDLKYVYNASRGRDLLFDLARDPDERHDISAAHPDVCLRLRQRLAAWKEHASGRLSQARVLMARGDTVGAPAHPHEAAP